MSKAASPCLSLVVFAAAGLLAACGQRGDLYFPEQQREVVPAVPATPASPAQAPAATPAGEDDDDAPAATTPRADPATPESRRP